MTDQFQSDIRIIKEVQKHANLYDPRCKDKDSKSRDMTWSSIARTLGLSVDFIKNRWKNLRDKYTREKKLMMIEGFEAYKIHSWPLIEEMSFLYNFVSHRNLSPSRTSISKSGAINLSRPHIQVKKFEVETVVKPKVPEWVNCDEVTPDNNVLDPTCVLVEEDEPIAPYDEEDDDLAPPDSKLRKLLEHKVEDISIYHNENLTDSNYHSESSASLKIPPQVRTLDEDEYYCLSLAGSLRRLPREKNSLLKIKILELVHEAQFGKVEEHDKPTVK